MLFYCFDISYRCSNIPSCTSSLQQSDALCCESVGMQCSTVHSAASVDLNTPWLKMYDVMEVGMPAFLRIPLHGSCRDCQWLRRRSPALSIPMMLISIGGCSCLRFAGACFDVWMYTVEEAVLCVAVWGKQRGKCGLTLTRYPDIGQYFSRHLRL